MIRGVVQFKPGSEGMLRGALGVLGGGVVGYIVFMMLAATLWRIWPGYASAAAQFTEADVYGFTTAMSGLHVAFWVVAEIGAGWIAVVISKQPRAARVLAGLLLIYAGIQHLVVYWDSIPTWYNLAVVVVVAPAALLGGRLAQGFARRA